MEVLFDRVAGLDIGKASVTVCAHPRPPDGAVEVRPARSPR